MKHYDVKILAPRAIAEALDTYHEWNDVTGFPPKGTSYDGELEGVMGEAAVRILAIVDKWLETLPTQEAQ